MPKINSGTVPNIRAGVRLRPGQVSGVAGFTPQEINGGVSTFGNRMVATKQRGGRGAGLSVQTVLVLPAIPATGAQFVYWTSAGAGTGDDQIWVAYAGQSAWTPMQKFTTLSGVPV